jgi:hypothetical protein
MARRNNKNDFNRGLGLLMTEGVAGLIIFAGVLLAIAILILLGLLEFPEFMFGLIVFVCLWFVL